MTQAEAIRLLNVIKCSLNQLLSLVHDMLDLKMIKENTFKINIEVFDPNETIKFIKDVFQC